MNPPDRKHLLGLDPGLRVTGYGVLELAANGPKLAEAGVLRSTAPTDEDDLPGRVKELYDGVVGLLDEWMPQAVAIEELYAHYDHPRTAILMAHARGTFLLAAAQRSIPVFSYSATQVKKTLTGHGRASKEQVQHCVMREMKLAKLPEEVRARWLTLSPSPPGRLAGSAASRSQAGQ